MGRVRTGLLRVRGRFRVQKKSSKEKWEGGAIFEVEEKLGGVGDHDWSFSFEETERTTRKVLREKGQQCVGCPFNDAHLIVII